uniref:Radical SAM core domain-containing protein n=1 Tax=Ditylum brightwellii TaxID=49249 RepID=A0A7S1YSZ5_9STRA|mmetsp:Transcript_16681/g.24712  ORF Transcript_16681/g.24712 Transcript_16681/m.24712 type:complete len:663 (+) Transcript_16681:687-2675(+)
MAERLKDDMFTKGTVDLIAGPDAYRDLPRLISLLLPPPPPPSPPPPLSSIDKKQQNYGTNNNSHEQHQTNNNDFEEEEGEYTLPKTASNVQLSLDETYAEITPVRHNPNDVSAFVSIMRGCNNMCSYCVVPFTRGRERSREFDSIVHETQHLVEVEHVKEVILLGQNVNSYHDRCQGAILATTASSSSSSSGGGGGVSTTGYYQTSNPGFTNLYKKRGGSGYYFADLVHAISNISPELRVRFTSPHPKDYPPELLHLMAETNNVCNQIHLPAQSGSNTVLERMRRGYTREAYLTLVDDVKRIIGNEDDDDDYVAFSSDFITGFCHETEEEHEDTIKLMQEVKYDQAYMFAYSMREKTNAHRTMVDDVPSDVKQRRLQEVISVFRTNVQERNEMLEVGRLRLVLVEGEARRKKKNDSEVVGRMWSGRTDQNKRVVFPSLLLNDDDDDDDGGDEGNRDRVRKLRTLTPAESEVEAFKADFWKEMNQISRRLEDQNLDDQADNDQVDDYQVDDADFNIGDWNMCERVHSNGVWCDSECRALDVFRSNEWSRSDVFLLGIMGVFMSFMMVLILHEKKKAFDEAKVYDGLDLPSPGLPPLSTGILFVLIIVAIAVLAILRFVNETLVSAVVSCILLFIYMLKMTLFDGRGGHFVGARRARLVSMDPY